MKKALLFLALPFVFIATLTAQITQEQADEIVINRMSDETKQHIIFAKEVVQMDGYTVITSKNEMLELDYSCFVYYIKYNEGTNGKYLIIKESNGNILEISTKNDDGIQDLEEWRIVPPRAIPFEEYSLSESFCIWSNYPSIVYGLDQVVMINSNEELEQYITCGEGSYPEIDFSKHTLLLVTGVLPSLTGMVISTDKNLLQLSVNEYKLNIELLYTKNWGAGMAYYHERWAFAIVTDKLDEESSIELNVLKVQTSCSMHNLSQNMNGNLIIINTKEEMENYFECTEYVSEIDFSNHTLLLASGTSPNISYLVNSLLIKTGENEYDFDLHIIGDATMPSFWVVKMLIAKLNPAAVISLKTHY